MRMRMRRYLAALAMLLSVGLSCPSGSRAQAGATGAITGTIRDAKGNSVSGATVVVTNVETGSKEREVTTSADGGFNVPSLAPTIYSVEIKAPGFARVILDSVTVRVTETATANATLQLGDASETVRVYDVTIPVELNSAMTGETIDGETASTLPLSTRNFLTLLTLSAGANTELFDSAALGRGPVTINVNGQRPTNNNYQLEGINSNDFNLPILDNVPLPNPDTIEEFKTQTSLYDASYGRNGGGNIQVNLRSGTSEFHGNLFEFFRGQRVLFLPELSGYPGSLRLFRRDFSKLTNSRATGATRREHPGRRISSRIFGFANRSGRSCLFKSTGFEVPKVQ